MRPRASARTGRYQKKGDEPVGGVVKKVVKSVKKVLGGGSAKVPVPQMPDYEAQRKKAEEEALKKRGRIASLGMAGTVLGGSYGDSAGIKTKKLLGE